MWKQVTLTSLAWATLYGVPSLTLAADDAAVRAAPSYYIVTRQDTRRCVAPLCGGYFVRAVNQFLTRCADGRWQLECHAFSVDTSSLGWGPETTAAFNEQFAQGHALARGTLQALPMGSFQADTLVATEGWQGQAQSRPRGTFYGLKDRGFVCITYPCDSIEENTLNLRRIRNIAGVDLAASGASEDAVAAGYKQLSGGGILAVGQHQTVTGPGGRGQVLQASEFYLPVGAER